MKVSDLAHHELFTAQTEETLDEAADRMSWHQVGALPVFEGRRLVGIITERDLGRAMARLLAGEWSRLEVEYEPVHATVAAGGIAIAWLAQTSVDWLHLLPGVTGAALSVDGGWTAGFARDF